MHRLILLLSSIALAAQSISLTSPDILALRNVQSSVVDYKGRKAVRVADSAGSAATDADRFAIIKGSDFHHGSIELDLAGVPGTGASGQARGFVGLAFRVAPDVSKFECIYLRPTNGRADDQLRRNHSVQYISYPQYGWERLREENPAQYETYVDLVPGEWTHVRIDVKGASAKLYVHGAAQPTLIVNDLKHGDSSGAIALWIGPGTEAHFANLQISR